MPWVHLANPENNLVHQSDKPTTKVTFGARAPKYWTPMSIMEEECKLMEVSTRINNPFLPCKGSAKLFFGQIYSQNIKFLMDFNVLISEGAEVLQ